MKLILKLFLFATLFAFAACDGNHSSDSENEAIKEVKVYFKDSITPRIVWEYSKGDSSYIKASHYYKNGKLQMQGHIKNGVRDGKWIAWDDQGRMLSTGNYKDGFEHGMWTVWFPSGQVRYEGMFDSGKRRGVWKFYDQQGKLLKEIEY